MSVHFDPDCIVGESVNFILDCLFDESPVPLKDPFDGLGLFATFCITFACLLTFPLDPSLVPAGVSDLRLCQRRRVLFHPGGKRVVVRTVQWPVYF